VSLKICNHSLQSGLYGGYLLLDGIMACTNGFDCFWSECYVGRCELLGVWLRLVVVVEGWILLLGVVGDRMTCMWSRCCVGWA